MRFQILLSSVAYNLKLVINRREVAFPRYYMEGGIPIDSSYKRSLINRVIDASQSDFWDSAVCEWVVDDCEEDTSLSSSCICGKENLRYLYTIRNLQNGNLLWPIGSCCIKKFDREDMDEAVSVTEGMFKLLHAILNNEFITLSTEFFSRKLLKKLYDEGAFVSNQYNRFDGYNDYQFMLDMFNKRDKSKITQAQHRKIRGIIAFSIRPFLEDKLTNRIHD